MLLSVRWVEEHRRHESSREAKLLNYFHPETEPNFGIHHGKCLVRTKIILIIWDVIDSHATIEHTSYIHILCFFSWKLVTFKICDFHATSRWAQRARPLVASSTIKYPYLKELFSDGGPGKMFFHHFLMFFVRKNVTFGSFITLPGESFITLPQGTNPHSAWCGWQLTLGIQNDPVDKQSDPKRCICYMRTRQVLS